MLECGHIDEKPQTKKNKPQSISQYLSKQATILSTSVSYGDMEAMLKADFLSNL